MDKQGAGRTIRPEAGTTGCSIYPTLRGALTAPRESGAGTRPASEPPAGRAEAASGAG